MQRFQKNVEVVYSLTSFYAASKEVEPDEFREFTQPVLSRCDEIQALKWAPRVAGDGQEEEEAGFPKQRAAHEQWVRGQGNRYREYRITELSEDGYVPAPERDEYFPVCFVEPYESNRATVGFDLGTVEVGAHEHHARIRATGPQGECDVRATVQTLPATSHLLGKRLLVVQQPLSHAAGPPVDAPQSTARASIGDSRARVPDLGPPSAREADFPAKSSAWPPFLRPTDRPAQRESRLRTSARISPAVW